MSPHSLYSGSYLNQTLRKLELRPLDLIDTANLLLSGRRKPSQATLRRALSTAYYALFHKLARSCADLLIGGENATKTKKAWRQTYRALAHTASVEACRNGKFIQKFPNCIQDFADTFVTMQSKRQQADYNPHVKYTKSEVFNDVKTALSAINKFETADKKDRRAFCAYVLFKIRQ